MTNEEKYKTPEERARAFIEFCHLHIRGDCRECPVGKGKPAEYCTFTWLALEAEKEKPHACPFCGCPDTATFETNGRQAIQCMACTATVFAETKDDAIAAWNRRVK